MAGVVLIGLMLATVAMLVSGVFLMSRGGEASRKRSNKLMILRVAFQGLAILVVAVLLMGKK